MIVKTKVSCNKQTYHVTVVKKLATEKERAISWYFDNKGSYCFSINYVLNETVPM